jgi:anti-sigma B factor antagonist
MKVERHKEYCNVILPEVIDLTNATELKEALQSLYEKDNCSIIKVDCARLEMIDSAGLGSLVLFQKKLKEREGQLKLINVRNAYIKHLFDLIDLRRVISIEEGDGQYKTAN